MNRRPLRKGFGLNHPNPSEKNPRRFDRRRGVARFWGG